MTLILKKTKLLDDNDLAIFLIVLYHQMLQYTQVQAVRQLSDIIPPELDDLQLVILMLKGREV